MTYGKLLLCVALQRWERYGEHSLAARDVAVAIAGGSSDALTVLSAYDYAAITPPTGSATELQAQFREDMRLRVDQPMREKMADFVGPIEALGLEVSTLLRVGDPRIEIVAAAAEIEADLIIIGSHSKRRLADVALGTTAQQVAKHAPCAVVMVSPAAS